MALASNPFLLKSGTVACSDLRLFNAANKIWRWRMPEFKPGDAVQLISGGPRMTVTQVGEGDFGTMTAWCVWFEGTKQAQGTFPVTALKHSPDPGPRRVVR
jgi:uncharacterized protein YodC (DUF2158 family)